MRILLDAASRTARYAPLGVDALAGALRELPGWRCDGSRLVRTLRTADVWGLLERVVDVEEELDHHADVTLENGCVTFTLWTHVKDAVTAADVELAQRLDAVAAALGVTPGRAAPADRG
jgi:4a-hydroxytetrahydrobiopterin dehydratase